MRSGWAALLLGMFAMAGAQAEPGFVQSARAKLLQEPRFDAAVVALLEKGAPVDVRLQQGAWLRVATGAHGGWLPKLLVGSAPPRERVTVIDTEGQTIADEARRRAASATTAGAARGLTAEDRRRASAEFQVNYSALARIESVSVDPAAAFRFLDEGLKGMGEER